MYMMTRRVVVASLRAVVPVVAMLGVAGTVACDRPATEDTQEALAATALVAPREVVVNASDFVFDMPDTIEAGATTFRLVNAGPDLHHVQLVRIEDGHSYADLLQAMAGGDHFPSFARFVGGPNTPVPGGESSTTVELEAGDYALICVIPARDGVLHIAKGMARPLTVVESATPTQPPAADVVMRLVDYDFETDIQLTPGRHVLRVENPADQPHEVIVVQLAPGKTLADMTGWLMQMAGPPPGRPVGGTTLIDPGEVNYVSLDLVEGDYALLCMVPDAADGAPHIVHGMARQIHVGET